MPVEQIDQSSPRIEADNKPAITVEDAENDEPESKPEIIPEVEKPKMPWDNYQSAEEKRAEAEKRADETENVSDNASDDQEV